MHLPRMDFDLTNAHRTTDDPTRLAAVGDYLHRRSPARVADVGAAKGLAPASVERTLRALERRGQARLDGDRWSWTGGPLLVRVEDMTERQRLVLAGMAKLPGGAGTSAEVADAAGCTREKANNVLVILAPWGWVTREKVRSKRCNGNEMHSTLTPAARVALGLPAVDAPAVAAVPEVTL